MEYNSLSIIQSPISLSTWRSACMTLITFTQYIKTCKYNQPLAVSFGRELTLPVPMKDVGMRTTTMNDFPRPLDSQMPLASGLLNHPPFPAEIKTHFDRNVRF